MSKHVIRLPKWNEKETEDSYMCVYLWYIYLYTWEMFIYICEIMAKIFISIVKIHIYIFQKLRISNRVYSKKAMAPHSSTLAWKIPRTEEPGRLQSMGSRRVGHDWATSLSLFTFMHRRRKWQPTPAFLPGESQGWGSLVGCRLWGCTESDTTEAT